MLLKASRLIAIVLVLLFLAPLWARAQPGLEVGTIAGSFDVTLSGSATYSIPIRIAPGTAGTEPRIALAYDSQAPGGSLGAGWSVSGLSVITRGPKNLLTDGVLDAVRFEETDALFLDGQRLIPISQVGAGATRRIEYRKETDDQSRIVQTGADFTSSVFLVETKGGLRILFDGAHNSRVRFSDASVFLVAASRITDTAGNYIEFQYRTNGQGDYDIESIRYTGHEEHNQDGGLRNSRRPYASIEFTYDTASRPFEVYVAGRLSRRTSRLRSIMSRVSSQPDDAPGISWSTVARYELEYDERTTANRFVLARVRQFGEDGSELTPTTFDYSAPQVGWQAAQFQLPIPAISGRERLGAAYRFVHFAPGTRRQLPDLLFSAQVEGALEAFAFRNDGGTWTRTDGFRPPFPFVSADGTDRGALLADLNGDDRIDLIQSYKPKSGNSESQAFLAGAAQWQSTSEYVLPFTLKEEGEDPARYFLGRFTGATGPDLIYEANGSRGFLANTGSGWQPKPTHAPPVALGSGSRLMNLNCQGTPELVVNTTGAGPGGAAWKAYRYDASGWVEITAPALLPPYSAATNPDSVLEIDLNQDGCLDLIVAEGGSLRHAFLASPSGWQPFDTKAPPFDLVDPAGKSVGAVVADVDADGRPDVIAHRRVPNAAPIRFAFRQTAVGWEPLPDEFLPPALGDLDPNAAPVNPSVVDVDGDGRLDIVLPNGNRSSFGRVYAGTANGFQEKPDYVPPVSFSRRNQQDGGIRFVDLNADGLPDVVFRREITKDGNTTQVRGAFINRGRGWDEAPGLVPPLPFAADYITGNPVQFVDVDGDGYMDLLYSLRRADGTSTQAYYRNEPIVAGQREPRRWVEQGGSGLAPPSGYPFAGQGAGDLGVRFADLNGDGRADMLVGVLSADTGQPAETCKTDANGQSVCELDRSVFQVAAFLNDGHAWAPTPAFNPPVPFVSQTGPAGHISQDLWTQTVDLDGDGLPDLVAAFRHPWDQSRLVQEVWFNTGAGWRPSADQILPNLPGRDTLLLDEVMRDPRALFQWTDVNGDGLADIVFSRRQEGSNGSATWLSTGRGFVEAPQWRIPLEAIADREGDPTFRLIDVNGDGFVDIIYARKPAENQVDRGLYINNGAAWVAADAKLVDGVPPFVDEQGVDQGVRLIDVDGNGLVDVVQAFASGPSSEVSEATVQINSGRRADVLLSLDTGYELRTAVSYQTLLETSPEGAGLTSATLVPWQRVYEPGTPAAYPIISPVPATYVVRRAVVAESGDRSIAFSYRYGDFRLDTRARRPLGFGWRESFNEVSGVLTRTEILQDARLRSLPRRDATCWIRPSEGPSGELLPVDLCPAGQARWSTWAQKLAETENTWQVVEGVVGGGPIPQRTLRQVHMAASSSRTYELDGLPTSWQTETLEYDAPSDILARRLNVLRTRTERGDGTSIETRNEYAQDDASHWFFGRLTRSTVTKTGDARQPEATERRSETRISTFAYDPATGLLKEGTADPGHLKAATTHYERDRFGNIVSTTISAAGEDPRTARTEYDELGRFVVAETNPLGHRTVREPRLTTGAPARTVDANGLVTRYEYDGFGRLRREISPNDVTKTTTMVRHDQIADMQAIHGIQAAFAVRTQVEKFPPTLQLYDNKGRLVRTITDGFTRNGITSRPIERDTVYDLLGRVLQTSVPRERGSASQWTSAKYDVLNRVSETRSVSGAITRRQFRSRPGGGSIVVETDPLGHTTLTERNMRGVAFASTDAKGGTTRQEYDASDRLLVSVGPTGATTRHTYDDVGQRVETQDPDLGVWRYEYDAFGHVVRQIDSNGQITTVEYDLLGRTVRKVQDDATWSWEYDKSRNGIGQVAAVSGSDGYRERYYYDSLSRLSRRAVTIGSEHFVTSMDYDRLGRVSRTHYPTAVSVENVYDAKGYHIGVRDPQTGNTYWTVADIDTLGRVVAETFGNGVTSTRRFDANTGRPTDLQVSTEKGPEVLDLSLEYDLVGNLRRRAEATANIRESFDYDELDRLTGMSSPNGRRDSYAFDAAGRITYRSGVGRYVYTTLPTPASASSAQAAPFHGVVATQNGGTRRAYEYDRAGNMVQTPGAHLRYTADNRLRLVFGDQFHWVRFDHAPGGQRYRQFVRDGQTVTETLYVGGYERITDFTSPLTILRRGHLVRHRYHLVNANGVFATVEISTEYADKANLPPNDAVEGPATTGTNQGARRRSNGAASSLSPPRPAAAREPSGPAAASSAIPSPNVRQAREVWYLHKDQLGSIVRITDQRGQQAARYWYDPWGKRKILSPGAVSWNRGFTGHEHYDWFPLIHMNGRVYHAALGAFTSVDLVNQSLTDTQTGNGYAYARGNPLRYVDPSGYSFFGDVVDWVGDKVSSAVKGFGHLLSETGKWLEENWRQVVIVAAVITVTVVTAGAAGPGLAAAILSGMAGGATGGALGAALYGGNFEDVLAGAVKGGVIGAFSGAAGYGVGAAFGGSSALSGAGRVLGRGAVEGATAGLRGGQFWRGFAVGAVSAGSATFLNFGTAGLNGALDTAKAAIIGGAISAISGDKFANGAILAVFAAVYGSSLANSIAEHGLSVRAVVGAVVDVAGKLWNLPNTYLGLAYGITGYAVGVVFGTGAGIEIGNNAVQFYNNPFAPFGAITFGNTYTAEGSIEEYGRHEAQHTYQGQVLGPAYLPSNLAGGLTGWIFGGDKLFRGSWHSRLNWNEVGPQKNRPQPWP